MLHDQTAYPEPFSFRPERFLDANGGFRDDPLLTSAFGFGRRLCPARHFVDFSLFISFSCILSVFLVGPSKDEHGNEIPVTLKDSGGNSRYVRQAAHCPHRTAVGAENNNSLMFPRHFFPVVHWTFGAPSYPVMTARKSSSLRLAWPAEDDGYDHSSQSPAPIALEKHAFSGLVFKLTESISLCTV